MGRCQTFEAGFLDIGKGGLTMPSDNLDQEQDRAWREWRDLALRAAETKTVDDAIASGKAFARFHYLFIERSYRPSEKVVPFARPPFDIGSAA